MQDYAQILSMVENHWRSLLVLHRHDPSAAIKEVLAFEDRVYGWAKTLSPTESASYLSLVAAARKSYALRALDNIGGLRDELGIGTSPLDAGKATDYLANLETPITLTPRDYLDPFWRKHLTTPPKNNAAFLKEYNQFLQSMQNLISSFTKAEQDAFMMRFALLNQIYIDNYKINPDAVRRELDMAPAPRNDVGKTVTTSVIGELVGWVFRLLGKP